MTGDCKIQVGSSSKTHSRQWDAAKPSSFASSLARFLQALWLALMMTSIGCSKALRVLSECFVEGRQSVVKSILTRCQGDSRIYFRRPLPEANGCYGHLPYPDSHGHGKRLHEHVQQYPQCRLRFLHRRLWTEARLPVLIAVLKQRRDSCEKPGSACLLNLGHKHLARSYCLC